MINIFAPINNLGYGVHANNMIKALAEEGHDTNLTAIGQVQSDPFFEPYWKPAAEKINQFDKNNPSVFIFHDEYSHTFCGSPALAFSVFETTKLKSASKNMLDNGGSDVVLVTTKEHKSLLEPQIDKQVEVVVEGVDDSIFNTIPMDAHLDTGKFTYITVGKKEERKNTDMILDSFMTMKDKNVALIAHTFNPFLHKEKDHPFKNLKCWTGKNPVSQGFEYKGFDGKAHKFTHKDCDIYFTAPTIPTSAMSSLYHSANVGIQASRGEGWDLPLAEMLACGLPVIATNCLGHKEYLEAAPDAQKQLTMELMGSEPAKDDIWFKDGEQGDWGIADPDLLIAKLDGTFESADQYKEKNEAIADYMSENYSWRNSVKQLINVIDSCK